MLKDAWSRPELDVPNAYYSTTIGRMYAALAPDTPPVYSSAVDAVARAKLNEAYSRCVQRYRASGEAGCWRRSAPSWRARRPTCGAWPTATARWRRPIDMPGAADKPGCDRTPWPYLFLSPYLLLTGVFFLVPFVNAIVLAFYETNGPRGRVFVGLANFRFLLHDPPSTPRSGTPRCSRWRRCSFSCRWRWGWRCC